MFFLFLKGTWRVMQLRKTDKKEHKKISTIRICSYVCYILKEI